MAGVRCKRTRSSSRLRAPTSGRRSSVCSCSRRRRSGGRGQRQLSSSYSSTAPSLTATRIKALSRALERERCDTRDPVELEQRAVRGSAVVEPRRHDRHVEAPVRVGEGLGVLEAPTRRARAPVRPPARRRSRSSPARSRARGGRRGRRPARRRPARSCRAGSPLRRAAARGLGGRSCCARSPRRRGYATAHPAAAVVPPAAQGSGGGQRPPRRERDARRDDEPAAKACQPARQRPVALDDGEHVARLVVARRRRAGAARGRRHAVPDAGLRHVDDAEARGSDAQAPLEILGVEEELLVEQACRVDRPRARRPSRRRWRGAVSSSSPRRVGLAEAVVAAAPEQRVEAGARVPEPVGVRRRAPCRRARPRPAAPPPRRSSASTIPGSTVASLLTSSTHSAPRSSARRMPTLLPPAKPRLTPRADQLDAREALRDRVRRAVGRAVVDARPSRSRAATRAHASVSSRPFHESTTATRRIRACA